VRLFGKVVALVCDDKTLHDGRLRDEPGEYVAHLGEPDT
jgi:hypothetical protein